MLNERTGELDRLGDTVNHRLGSGESDSPREGSTLSLALRLRKRKKGTSQTQTPKKVATSMKERSRRPAYGLGLYLASHEADPGRYAPPPPEDLACLPRALFACLARSAK